MAVLKCKMCGGDLSVNPEETVAVCEYCGTKQTVPVLDDEKKQNLFNRANRLRMNSEFDKAAVLYENIIAEFPEEAEGYWGLVICNYGIEYVDDATASKKIPTCHRVSFDSVLSDENYKLALEYADVVAQKVYRDEAREIDRIREEILSISKNEQPYDIFICYKETDEKGDRTIDSVIAQDVYDALTAKGYRVFFSRISLEDKLGLMYEPYIFAALSSSKLMLAFGTKYEHYHAVWVKNEWSRFLKFMAKDKTKMLIPCYRDMDAYDLPDEFKALQAQDMGKVGATQDLLRGIEKIFGVTSAPSQPVAVASVNPTTDALLQRAQIFLEEGNYKSADEYCEKVLDIEPTNYKPYLVKLLIEYKITSKEQLIENLIVYDGSHNYQNAVRFASEGQLDDLKEHIQNLKNDRVFHENEKKYQSAVSSLERARNKTDYALIAKAFESLGNFRDSAQKADLCNRRVIAYEYENIYEKAVSQMQKGQFGSLQQAAKMFESIKGYRDSEEKMNACNRAIKLRKKEAFDQTKKTQRQVSINYHVTESEKNIKKEKDTMRSFMDIVISIISFAIILLVITIIRDN